MPGILSSAVEFCEGAPCKNSQASDLSKLHKRLEDNFVKNQARPSTLNRPPPPRRRAATTPRRRAAAPPPQPTASRPHSPQRHARPTGADGVRVRVQGDVNNDIMKVKTLIYAHLLQEPIPASLKADAEDILQHGHRLLNGLLNICMEQRFVTATINCIEFSQHLTQGLWFHSNPLLQLPHFDQREVKLISHKLSKTPGSLVEKAKELGPEKRREALHGLSEEQHVDIDLFLDHFPDIELSYDARVEDEEDVREGDVLNLTVTVVRKHLPDDGLPDEDDDDDDDDPDEAIFDKELEAYDEVNIAEKGTPTLTLTPTLALTLTLTLNLTPTRARRSTRPRERSSWTRGATPTLSAPRSGASAPRSATRRAASSASPRSRSASPCPSTRRASPSSVTSSG